MLEVLRLLLTEVVGYLQLILEAISVICILTATIRILCLVLNNWCHKQVQDGRKIRLIFGNWLATALEFQLAADILITTVAPDMDRLIQLAVIAVIRTFLNYFLSKELETEQKTMSS